MNNTISTKVSTANKHSTGVIESAKYLLVKDGLMLDREFGELVTESSNHISYSVNVECGKDILIINVPLVKGVLNVARLSVHSEMNGELVMMRGITKSPLLGTYHSNMLAYSLVNMYKSYKKTDAAIAKRKEATSKVLELEKEIASTKHNRVVLEALHSRLRAAKKDAI